MKKQLLIFDMDGLMFDTERINYQSWLAFQEEYDVSFTEKTKTDMNGMTLSAIIDQLTLLFGDRDKAIEFRQKQRAWREREIKSYTGSIKKKGLVGLLDYLKSNEIKAVVASSSPRENVHYLLQKENVFHYFDAVFTGDMCSLGKPDPEIFLKTLESMNIQGKDAIVLEDSVHGAIAAKRANIDCFIVPDSSFTYHPDYPESARIFSSLTEIQEFLEGVKK